MFILYPNVATVPTIRLTMPVSTATPKWSFSTLRKVKTYTRSTMRAEQPSSLAMHGYRDTPLSDTEYIVEEFCAKKKRRLASELSLVLMCDCLELTFSYLENKRRSVLL